MYVIRRRTDGHFYTGKQRWTRGPGFNYTLTQGEPCWTTNLNRAKPFNSRKAAVSSSGMQIECPYPMPNWNDDSSNSDIAMAMRQDWFEDKTAKRRLKKELYEAVEIEVRVKGESEGVEGSEIRLDDSTLQDIRELNEDVIQGGFLDQELHGNAGQVNG